MALATAPAFGASMGPIVGGAPIAATAGLAGSITGTYLGDAVGKLGGELIGEIRAKNPENNVYGSSDPMTRRFGGVSIEYNPAKTVEDAAAYGGAIGSISGGMLGGMAGSAAAAKGTSSIYNTIGQGRAAMKYQGKPSTLKINVSPYGTATPPKVEGVSNWQLFKKGLTAPRQYADGRLRLGGPQGVRISNGQNTLNAGSFVTPEMVQQTSLRFNNPNSPLNINTITYKTQQLPLTMTTYKYSK